MERSDVVVIGLGVMGSATALALARRGVETVALEQHEIGHARGSSHGATRIFRLSYPHPDYVRMARRALPLWRALEEEAGEELLVTTGGLDAGPSAKECADALAAEGVGFEWLDPKEAVARFSAISFEGLGRVLFQPDAGVSLADRAVAAQIRLAGKAGADVGQGVRVSRLSPDQDGVVIEMGTHSLRARRVVVCAGTWTTPLLAGIANVSVRSTLQTVSYFHPLTETLIPTWIEWREDSLAWYAVPPAGTAPGMKVADHRPGRSVDPGHGPFAPDDHAERGTADYVKRRFPGLEPWPVASETCLYEMSPDEDFILDRVGPVVVGAGFSGHGFKFAPLIGEILADLATGREPPVPLDRFRAYRFR